LKIGISEYQFPDVHDYFKAFEGAGAHRALDGNNGEAYGTSWYQATMNPHTGERSHARNSYYEPVMPRSNLEVLLGTEVTEIVFGDNKTLTAEGVKIKNRKTNSTSTVYARKEVVLAAGAINTPKLLQVSGVGPKSVLQAAGIPVKLEHDGVGANFQDHPYTGVMFNMSNEHRSEPNGDTLKTDAAFNASAWEEYRVNRTGPLTQARGNSIAFIPLPEVDPENYHSLANRVLELKDGAYLPSVYSNNTKLLKGVKAQREVLAGLFQNDKAGIVELGIPDAGAFELMGLEKPVSRGTVMIDPTNPQGAPKVLFNSFQNPIDKAVFAACVRYIRKVWARPELEKYSLVETLPGAQAQTDEEIMDAFVQAGSITPSLAHPSCSCAMMPEDMGGCVSDELLFYGIKQLSIVDASIIPLIPSQHLQSTMYAIGEKAADIIKSRA
jgi:choline dehydrogenase-like flavoprotein